MGLSLFQPKGLVNMATSPEGNFHTISVVGEPKQPHVITSATDPDEWELMKDQLFLLRHAQECQKRDQAGRVCGDHTDCTFSHCRDVKDLLNHIVMSLAGRNCSCKDELVESGHMKLKLYY